MSLSRSRLHGAKPEHWPWWGQYRGISPALTNTFRLRHKREFKQDAERRSNAMNIHMNSDKPMMTRAMCALSVTEKIVVIISVILFCFQYVASLEIMRAQNAIQFAVIQNGEKFIESRDNLNSIWEKVDMDRFKGKTEEEIEREKYAVIGDYSKIRGDVIRLTDLYSVVIKCVNIKKCDDDTINGIFKDEIIEFFCAHAEFIRRIGYEFNNPNYSDTIKAYVNDHGHPRIVTPSGVCDTVKYDPRRPEMLSYAKGRG